MKKLEGKRALVTGAARGIGRAIAERFAAEGATVLLADIDGEEAATVAKRLQQTSRTVDVSRKSEIDALFDHITSEWGSLDILVNNAGVTHAAELLELTEADFDRVFAINLKSALFATQRAVPLMQRGACIINMSSVNAILAIPTQIPYAISKGAMRQFMTAVAASILTDAQAEHRVLSRTPLGRFGEASEVASVAVFLASDDSSYITGQTIYPDGGRLGLNYTVPVLERG
jgi:NAD(P)-dependent dehydrogenase (short-subunit alcohol dehydrogenase family)